MASVGGSSQEVLITATPEMIDTAIAEYNDASDRVAVLVKYPWLADTLNKIANQPKTKS